MGPIKVNLATFEYYDKRFVYSVILGAAILVLMVSAFNIKQSFQYQDEIFDFAGKIKRLDQTMVKRQRIDIGSEEPLGKESMKWIDESVPYVNKLITADVFPWGRVLGVLEKEMPDGMVLKGFFPSDDFRKITLKGQSQSMADISVFLHKLESSKVLEKPVLSKLNAPEANSESGSPAQNITFEIDAALNAAALLAKNASEPGDGPRGPADEPMKQD